MYTEQKLQVKWRDKVSECFHVTNGVKQGGVISPILFAIYIDGLLCKLKASGKGCYMGNQYIGCLAFADDITLLCPTQTGLRHLVDICEEYAMEYNIKFNGLNSQYLIFSGRGCIQKDRTMHVNGIMLQNSQSAVHLGHKICTDDKDSLVSDAIAKFWKSFNLFIADLGHIYSSLKCKLFKQYCCSFYGAPLWLLSSNRVEDLCIAWRKALRNLWNVPNMTHKDIIVLLSGTIPLKMSLESRFLKFIKSGLQGPSKVIQSIIRQVLSSPYSVCGINYRNVIVKYKLGDIQGADFNKIKMCFRSALDTNTIDNVKVLHELIEMRDGFKDCDIFTETDINDMIRDICIF